MVFSEIHLGFKGQFLNELHFSFNNMFDKLKVVKYFKEITDFQGLSYM